MGESNRGDILTVSNLHHTYLQGTPLAQPALFGVNLVIPAGSCVAIIGHTGSGKSTLIQHFNGLLRPQMGEVVVNGARLSNPQVDIRAIRQQVGLVFQNPEDQIFERLVGDDIAYGPLKQGIPLSEVVQRAKWAMGVVGLDFDEMKNRSTFAMSGGEKRKVALAGVLVLRPQILVLDEPTAGLDPRSRRDLLRRIRDLNRSEGLTVVFVSHNMEEVAYLADTVYVLAAGHIAFHGTPRELFGALDERPDLQVGAPPGVEILRALHSRGYHVDTTRFTVPEVAEEVAAAASGQRGPAAAAEPPSGDLSAPPTAWEGPAHRREPDGRHPHAHAEDRGDAHGR
ncbi:MAG: ATP-binding cassette domain-containing protein [Alicyclobacillus sp.]|nr:ATP-binding cassette domain-containing protein [Alicyclobacillus sp.]